MPLYEYVCDYGHVAERVRPSGVDLLQCPACGGWATRRQVYRTHVVGPTVNTLRMAALAMENLDERQDAFRRVTAETGETVIQPNDWAGVKWEAAEMVRRGEVDTKAILREVEGDVLQGRKATG